MPTEHDYNVDRSPGSGSRSEHEDRDDDGAREHDGRSKTRTGFDAREVRDDDIIERFGETYRRWEWLNHLHEGQQSRGYESNRRRADARRAAKTYMSRLELTEPQRERVLGILSGLETLNFGDKPYELTVLSLITLVANEDGRWIRDERDYRQILKNLDGSPQGIRKLRTELRDEL